MRFRILLTFLLVLGILIGCGPSPNSHASIVITAGHPQTFDVVLVNNTPYVITPTVDVDPSGYGYTTVVIYPYSSVILSVGYLPQWVRIGGYYNSYYYNYRYYYLDIDYYYYSSGITFYYV